MTRNLSVLNLLSVILMIIVSYYSQAIRLNNNTIGGVSDYYENLFTPAGYAFSIWGLIYVALLVYCIFQLNRVFVSEKETDFILQTGPWFIIANIANAAWVVAWLYENTFLSVILMFIILGSLIKIILNTNMERWDAPPKIIAFTWWPICFYSGWITVAAVANVSAHLTNIGWRQWFLSEQQWMIIMLVVTVIINLLIVYRRNMREFALVGIWALVAIYVRQINDNPGVAYTALAGGIIIFSYVSYHGYVNRKSNPMFQLVAGENNEAD
ncbi:tryptophan-rich sensory protein [Antarcticibacterium sp. 1MA-6-2]|uniref:tryptophan-rich sensory protein n=1 Tax=Antarcticibacterium sp. 1MA-6-2 TaxID=2908210 RepID=UPI001F3BDF66|nr:tryptophan-rich sensory protein [Antarcticibacterium sp. 1MA-6-2]UJH90452.1 tryptophan-rich sensory protein [Antarcticibacterium sp. 1MA-6-2]